MQSCFNRKINLECISILKNNYWMKKCGFLYLCYSLNYQFYDIFIILFKMTSLYFATSKGGYVQRVTEGAPKAVTGRQIPVYKRVNQYMNLPAKEQDKSIIKQVDEEAEYFEPQKSTRSLDTGIQKGIKCTLVKSAHIIEKSQGESSIGGEEMTNSLIKQRQYSSKDTSTSQVDLPNRKNIKVSIIESQIGKNEEYEEMFDRNQLQRQIEKEKTLRKNLENSYFSLLQKLNKDSDWISTDFDHSKTQTNKKERQTSILHQHDQIEEVKHQIRKSSFEAKRSKSEASEQCIKYDDQEKSHTGRVEDDQMHSLYCRQLKRQRYFQQNLISEINNVNARMEELETNLLKRQMQMEKIIRQRQEQKMVSQSSNRCVSGTSSMNPPVRQQNEQGFKNQIHYIFTIFVMFLIIAMIAKNKQK